MKPSTGILSCPADRTTTPGVDYWAYGFTYDGTSQSHNRSYLWAYNSGYRYGSGVFLTPFWKTVQLTKPDRDMLLWCSDWPQWPAYSEAVFFGDFTYEITYWAAVGYPALHGNGKVYNAAFMDGHVQYLTASQYLSNIQNHADWD